MAALPRSGAGMLQPAFRGIPEPPADGTPASGADLAVAPGTAFSWQGVRLDDGKGYDDRLLAIFRQAFRVGLPLGEQLFREIPEHSHDVRLDALVVDGVRAKGRERNEDVAEG